VGEYTWEEFLARFDPAEGAGLRGLALFEGGDSVLDGLAAVGAHFAVYGSDLDEGEGAA